MQTPKQVFNAQMHFQPADRCFFMENGFWEELYRDWPLFREHGVRDYRQACALLQMDELVNLWGDVFSPNTSIHPAFERKTLRVTDTTVIVTNGYGSMEEKFKGDAEGGRMFGGSVSTPEDWKRVKAERYDPAHPDRAVDFRALKERFAGKQEQPLYLYMGSLIGLSRRMFSFEGFAYACYDYPEMIEDIVETNCRLIEDMLDQVLPHFAFDIASTYENITCKSGPLMPVWLFREAVVPRLKRIKRKLLGHGVDVWAVGSDGDIRPLLPYFLEGGVNCLSPCEVVGCAHPGELLDRYPGELRIIGGVDKLEIAKGREAIDAYLDSIAPYVARGGFIPTIDHDVPPSIRQEDFLYYLERRQGMFG